MAVKRRRKEGLLDSLLGFTPGETAIKWILENYGGQTVSYKEIDREFLFEVYEDRNYYKGTTLSAFDLCRVRIHPGLRLNLPPVELPRESGSASTSFIEEYMREISVFPTLSREEELELAMTMEVAYIRYKNSLCYCPALLDFLNEEFEAIRQGGELGMEFDVARFKNLVIPGATNLDYPKLWKLVDHQWKKIMDIRKDIKDLGVELHRSEEISKEKLVKLKTFKFAVCFLLKDLNIKESIFHSLRDRLVDVEHKYPHLKDDFKLVRDSYDQYISYKNLMVNYNLKLVVSIARKFFKPKISPMDVIQYGNEGLIRAAEDYNYKLKFKFSTYAIWWIRQKIQEGIQEQEHMIRIPAYRLHLSKKYSAIKERLAQEGEKNDDESLAKELDLTIDQVKKLKSDPAAYVMAPHVSSDGEEGDMLEQMVDESSVEDEKTYDDEAVGALKSHLKLYPVRERFILTLRYGLASEDIFPVKSSMNDIETQLEAIGEDVSDDDLDKQMNPILFEFNSLPLEVKVPVDAFKKMKVDLKADSELVREVFPFKDQEVETARIKTASGKETSAKEKTLLALIDGFEFDECVMFKSRDRLILSKIWLQTTMKASVVRKIINQDGLILDEVAKVFGLTKERVRQIEAKVLRNISYHLVLP